MNRSEAQLEKELAVENAVLARAEQAFPLASALRALQNEALSRQLEPAHREELLDLILITPDGRQPSTELVDRTLLAAVDAGLSKPEILGLVSRRLLDLLGEELG